MKFNNENYMLYMYKYSNIELWRWILRNYIQTPLDILNEKATLNSRNADWQTRRWIRSKNSTFFIGDINIFFSRYKYT